MRSVPTSTVTSEWAFRFCTSQDSSSKLSPLARSTGRRWRDRAGGRSRGQSGAGAQAGVVRQGAASGGALVHDRLAGAGDDRGMNRAVSGAWGCKVSFSTPVAVL